ncbi:mCG1035637, partial [Mus musculus]
VTDGKTEIRVTCKTNKTVNGNGLNMNLHSSFYQQNGQGLNNLSEPQFPHNESHHSICFVSNKTHNLKQ